MSVKTTVADIIVEQLAAWGVKYVFGIPGHSSLGIVEALRKNPSIKYLAVRHEEVAALMASAYAKLTGEVGVCLTIAGPGATNLMTGLYDAKMDRAPVLALTGQVKLQYIGPGSFQEIDQDALFHPVCVFNKTINSKEQTVELVTLALKHAITKRGVSHLAVPNNVQKELLDAEISPREGSLPNFLIEPSQEILKEAVALIDEAKRPVIIVGWGARVVREDVLKLAKKISAPIATTFRAKGIISEYNRFSLGMVGKTGTIPARKMVNTADLLIVFGSSFSEQTNIPKNIPIIQVDWDSMNVAKTHPVKLGIWGNTQVVIPKLLALVKAKERKELMQEARKLKASWENRLDKEANPRAIPLSPQYIMKVLEDSIAKDVIISVDVGENCFWLGRNFRMNDQQTLLMSGYMGTMGFGLPGALAAKLAQPHRQVICVTGDGGFSQVMGDFLTAVKYNLNIIVIVLNNQELAMITVEQRAEGYPKFATDLTNPDFAEYAKICGGAGFKVKRPGELENVLEEALKSPKPTVVDIDTEPKRIF